MRKRTWKKRKKWYSLTRKLISFSLPLSFSKSTRYLKRKVFIVNLILKFNFHICMHYTITFCVISFLCVSVHSVSRVVHLLCLTLSLFHLHLLNLLHFLPSLLKTEQKTETIPSKHQSMIFPFLRQRARDREKENSSNVESSTIVCIDNAELEC